MKSLFNKTSLLFMQLMYGVSLIFPYSSQRPNYLVMPDLSILLLVYAVLSLFIYSIVTLFWIVIFFFIVIFFLTIKFNGRIIDFVNKLRVERYYRIKIPSNKVDDYLYIVEAIRLHRKYGKYDEYDKFDRQAGRLKYIEDQSLIKEYRRFNRKWEMIAGIYIVLHIVVIYYWNKC